MTRAAALLCAALLAAGCASAGPDPLEKPNRGMLWLNDGADRVVLAPLGKGWSVITPEAFRRSLAKLFANLGFPNRFLANLLQAEVRGAGVELGRFLLNSTVGLAGLFDPAGHLGMEPREEDFGQAFGRWGIGSGAYLMLPLLGPSSPRDLVGTLFDTALNGATWIQIWVPGLGMLDRVNRRALVGDEYEQFREASFDFYVGVRDAHLRTREAAVRNEPVQTLEPEDDFYDLDDEAEPGTEPGAEPEPEPQGSPGADPAAEPRG